MEKGSFIISLDFELMWGVRDKKGIEQYGSNILSVHTTLKDTVKMFNDYNVKSTIATVGFLLAQDKEGLEHYLPKIIPNYDDVNLNPYNYLKSINANDNLYHFASDLIKWIRDNGNHEIATHTFSHYYCLEAGQNTAQFADDIESAVKIAADKNLVFESIIFPRNQFIKEYMDVAISKEIKVYRGTEKSWIYRVSPSADESIFKRLLRLIDAYINITGRNDYSLQEVLSKMPYNIPSSRFLRPFNKSLRLLEPLKVRRIKRAMTKAARNNKIYHIWWHPHNFGSETEENFKNLEEILEHYKYLNKTYGFESKTMSDLVYKNDK